MVGFGPSAGRRVATFGCALVLVPALDDAEVLVAALLSLLGEEPHPAKATEVATMAIAAPAIAVRFIALAPVDRASPRDNLSALSRPSLDCAVHTSAIYALSLMFPVCGNRMLISM